MKAISKKQIKKFESKKNVKLSKLKLDAIRGGGFANVLDFYR